MIYNSNFKTFSTCDSTIDQQHIINIRLNMSFEKEKEEKSGRDRDTPTYDYLIGLAAREGLWDKSSIDILYHFYHREHKTPIKTLLYL